MPQTSNHDVILEVADLRTHFEYEGATVRAVDGVSFDLSRNETLAVVGESGSGKSMLAASILGLMPSEAARIVSGEVTFIGTNLVGMDEKEIRKVRGRRIALMSQDPMTALNPALKVSDQMIESLVVHTPERKHEAEEIALDLLSRTRLPNPGRVFDSYPHELSGGMRQRVLLAMALMNRPDVLIADEPTTALDVTTQEQIIDLIRDLQEQFGLAVILISHDLGVVARVADRVIVMYAGKAVESASAFDLYGDPLHPYTIGLLGSMDLRRHEPRQALPSIPGLPPPLDNVPSGCSFHPRCAYAVERCRIEIPELEELRDGHFVACHLAPVGKEPSLTPAPRTNIG